jgi:Fe-S-cluster containining protein
MTAKKTRGRRAAKKAAPGGPPQQDIGGLEFDARRAERLQTAELLRKGRTPLTVIEVAEKTAALAEQTVAEAMASYPPPPLACKEGCDWCCYLTVGTTVPEVARIVEYLRQTLSPEDLQATRERVCRLDDQRRERKFTRGNGTHLPCALLVNQRCSAYPARPLTCRGFNSSDAHQCELFLQAPNKVTVPLYAPQLRLTTFVLDGLRAGLTESRLNGDRLELTAALRIAFEVPNAIERWLAGEPVFAPARLD